MELKPQQRALFMHTPEANLEILMTQMIGFC